MFDINFIQAQSIIKKCSTVEYDKYLKAKDLGYNFRRSLCEYKTSTYLHSRLGLRNSSTTVVIPVVVHIIWNTPQQNIPDEQIVSQMDAVNEDYSVNNANITELPPVFSNLVGNTHFFFSLARRDPNGNPTTGIVRSQTANAFFNSDDTMKFDSLGGSSAWDKNHYLNIWVCNLQDGSSQIILGYGQYPDNADNATDGVVVNSSVFGRIGNELLSQYNLGKTTTHEIGHWLNLYHIWGDDGGLCNYNGGNDDYINDTPDQADATYGSPEFPKISCNNQPDGDLYFDYMDYTDDRSMMLFTNDQLARMNAALNIYRSSILSAQIYTTPINKMPIDLTILSIDSPASFICNKNFIPWITLKNNGIDTIFQFSLIYHIDKDSSENYQWNGILMPDSIINISLPQMRAVEKLHIYFAEITSVNGVNDDYSLDNIKTKSFYCAPEKYSCPVYPEVPSVLVFPNPTAGMINIKSKFKETNMAELTICDIIGKIIYSSTSNESHSMELIYNTESLSNGMYFVQIKTFENQASAKFVVFHN